MGAVSHWNLLTIFTSLTEGRRVCFFFPKSHNTWPHSSSPQYSAIIRASPGICEPGSYIGCHLLEKCQIVHFFLWCPCFCHWHYLQFSHITLEQKVRLLPLKTSSFQKSSPSLVLLLEEQFNMVSHLTCLNIIDLPLGKILHEAQKMTVIEILLFSNYCPNSCCVVIKLRLSFLQLIPALYKSGQFSP